MPITDADQLRDILQSTTTIAVVGASSSPDKAAHRIPAYLQTQGYKIVPVNPGSDEILGEPTVGSLAEIDEHVNVVDVFRPADEAPDIARAAVELGADVLWLQQGIVSEEAEQIATDGGLQVVMGRCMGAEHGTLGLGPGPH